MNISFILLNRNNPPEVVRKAIDAVYVHLRGKESEVILVDDASDYSAFDEFGNLPVKLIVNKKRRGIGFSRMKAIMASSGELFFFIDADIEITSLEVEAILNAYNENDSLIAISGRYFSKGALNWNRALDLRRQEFYGKNGYSFYDQASPDQATFSGGFCCFCAARIEKGRQRACLKGGGEDILFQIELLNQGFEFGFDPGFSGHHHHIRDFRAAYHKAVSDAHGAIRVISHSIKGGLCPPKIELFTGGPFFIFVAFFSPEHITSLLLLELAPVLIVCIKNRSMPAVQLLLYESASIILRMYYFLLYLIFGRLSWRQRGIFIKFYLFSGLQSKYYWLKRQFRSHEDNYSY